MRQTLTILGLALALGLPGAVLAGPVEDAQRRKAIELYKKGEDLLKGEKFEQAAEQFKKAIELNKDLVLAHSRRRRRRTRTRSSRGPTTDRPTATWP
jgi:tetratricopeptide (TPR) repeat protein